MVDFEQLNASDCCSDCLWRRDVVVITTKQSTKPKLKFSRGSNPALTMIFDYQSNLVIFFVLS